MPQLLTAAAGVAHNFAVLDEDGVMRRYVPFVRAGADYIPSVAVAGAVAALGLKASEVRLGPTELRLGDRRMPLIAAPIPMLDGSVRSVAGPRSTTAACGRICAAPTRPTPSRSCSNRKSSCLPMRSQSSSRRGSATRS